MALRNRPGRFGFSRLQHAGVSRRAGLGRRRPSFEGLESRALLATLFVAPSGSDAGPGTSGSAPFRTIQQAVTAASSGDEIRVAAGTYTYDSASDHLTKKQTYTGVLGTSPVVALIDKQVSILGGFSS